MIYYLKNIEYGSCLYSEMQLSFKSCVTEQFGFTLFRLTPDVMAIEKQKKIKIFNSIIIILKIFIEGDYPFVGQAFPKVHFNLKNQIELSFLLKLQ